MPLNTAAFVVYRTIPTSNHNLNFIHDYFKSLYIVLFLHQTTTTAFCSVAHFSCISYYSYIKPQLELVRFRLFVVVYRTIPTSNHNPASESSLRVSLYIVLFLHQTTTIGILLSSRIRCISYYSYIKPQLNNQVWNRNQSCISYYSYIKPQPIMLI